MKTLGIKTVSLLLLSIWILIHLPLNLLHHHDEVCAESVMHKQSNEVFHLHESGEEFCFFCSESFVKELNVLSQEYDFNIKFPAAKINVLHAVILSLFKGQTTGRAPPL